MFRTRDFLWRGEQFELVRYEDGSGRVYHSSGHIAIENAHAVADASRLVRLLDGWLRDGEHRPVVVAE